MLNCEVNVIIIIILLLLLLVLLLLLLLLLTVIGLLNFNNPNFGLLIDITLKLLNYLCHSQLIIIFFTLVCR